MAQETSSLWKELIRNRNTQREYKFVIDGVECGADAEISHSVSGGLFETFGIGNATATTLNLVIEADNIPRGAQIKRFVRLVLGDQVSEWLPKGVFYVNRRSESDGIWTIEAFDSMRKAAVPYVQAGVQEEWPVSAPVAVDRIRARLGTDETPFPLDARTVLDKDIMVGYPDKRTMQTVLAHIAAAHAGNFIITDAGYLRLVPLVSIPEETSLLVDEYGDYITLGEVRIRV